MISQNLFTPTNLNLRPSSAQQHFHRLDLVRRPLFNGGQNAAAAGKVIGARVIHAGQINAGAKVFEFLQRVTAAEQFQVGLVVWVG